MNASVAGERAVRAPAALAGLRAVWFAILGALVLAAPLLLALAQQVWTTDQGAQGPIILATGLWLLAREEREARPVERPGRLGSALATIGAAGAIYVVATIFGMLWLRCLGAYLALLGLCYGFIGGAALRRLWFPFLYLLFLVPPPFSAIAPLTWGLKNLISTGAVDVLSALGFQVASSGSALYIDGYELLVAAACSGMNSLVSLLAIGLFYIYLRHRAEWRYAALLALLVIPIAILANLVRVIILLLITHYFGDAVAQGMLHEATGMMMFFVALFALVGADALLSPVRRRLAGAGA